MHIVPILFIISEVIATTFYKRFYFYIQYFTSLATTQTPGKPRIIVIDRTALFFLITLVMHLALLVYCLYLMFVGLWQPASMLLILSALESFAVKNNISGVTIKSSKGFTYPTALLKYTISTLTLFVLIQLAQ